MNTDETLDLLNCSITFKLTCIKLIKQMHRKELECWYRLTSFSCDCRLNVAETAVHSSKSQLITS